MEPPWILCGLLWVLPLNPPTDGLQVMLMNMATTRVLHKVWSRPASNSELSDARNAQV